MPPDTSTADVLSSNHPDPSVHPAQRISTTLEVALSRIATPKISPISSSTLMVSTVILILSLATPSPVLRSKDLPERAVLLRTIPAEEARQAVAVDSQFVYAIDNARVGKYAKSDGRKVNSSDYSGIGITHLNSGVVVAGQLICAHSNYPKIPMASSVEIFDTGSLQHIGSRSLGTGYGSLTWVDFHDGLWWGCFAHYEGKGGEPGKGPEWTTVVAFDSSWTPKESWLFPSEVVERFRPYSCSGGCWVSSTLLLCTGHDRTEAYLLALPRAGSYLKLRQILDIPIPGQGIAVDPCDRTILYGIDREKRQILVVKLEWGEGP